MGNNNDPNNYYMSLNLIGDSMDQFLYCISGISSESLASQKQSKKSLYDYWDYFYNTSNDFFGQLAITMNRLKIQKDSLILNFRECLIVRVENIESIEIQYILQKVNSLNREYYIPIILFLCNSFEPEDLKKLKYDEEKYPKIDRRMVFFEKFEADIMDEEKMRRIRYRLERFCSYYNELGDRFTVGNDIYKNDYDLTEMNFPFTVNICCVGRFGKGKSTAVNCILGEKNAKENKSGTSATLKINYYQVSQFPIKIYDLPGFENLETINNAVKQFKYLNEEIHQLQDQIHIFLYFIKSTDERMFSEMEFKIFKQISNHKDSFVIYVLTHSSEKTDKKEIYDMINTGIKGAINKNRNKKKANNKEKNYLSKKEEQYQNIYLKMYASQDNCVFVNFHKTSKLPLYGLSDFFNKIAQFGERTEAYNKFQKNSCISEEEFQQKIKEEAKIRKIRAKAIISKHKIFSGIVGLLPGVDYIANRYFIKKDAARKAGQIFGFDLKQLEESLKKENSKKKINLEEETPHLKMCEETKSDTIDEETINESINEENNKEKKEEEKNKKKQFDKKVKYRGYGSMYACTAVSYSTSLPRYFLAAGGVGLIAVSAAFSVIGCALGAGVGCYLMKRHCEDLLDQFELLFIQNAEKMSDSLIFGINYLRNMSEYYKKLGY
jgi:GTP-binding protein EngB required for normal cell division